MLSSNNYESSFVRLGDTLINVTTICAATMVNGQELRLWFPGSTEGDGPSFTLKGAEAMSLWTLLKQQARTPHGSENSVG